MRVNSVSTQSRTEESEFEHIPKAICILQKFSTLHNQPIGSSWNLETLDLMSNLNWQGRWRLAGYELAGHWRWQASEEVCWQ